MGRGGTAAAEKQQQGHKKRQLPGELGSEAQEEEAEHGRGVFLGLEARVGAELVGGVPETLFQRGVAGVFF